MRNKLIALSIIFGILYFILLGLVDYGWLWFSPLLFLCIYGLYDAFQKKDSLARSYPLLAHLSHLMEKQKHVMQEILILNRREGRPFDQVHKEIAIQRSSGQINNQPFGTDYNLNKEGKQYAKHSMFPLSSEDKSKDIRIKIGGPKCLKPYSASLINVAGMSYGSISEEAIKALALGAKKGDFSLNTGEGGFADFHDKYGNDVIFQFGTGYFGCRTKDGKFDSELFSQIAKRETVKMIEIKISQGAKPGYGAILPASKNTEKIAEIRKIESGTEVLSPAYHSEFHDPKSLCKFIERLRELSEGKPIGIKFCLGRESEMRDMADAFHSTGDGPDYIAIDGSEGGTGAAHYEALHFTGMPLAKSLPIVDSILKEYGIRDEIKLIASGKLISAFDILRVISHGADGIYIARGFMFSLGCLQSLKCNLNICPVGITTMDQSRRKSLIPEEKGKQVYNFHKNTLKGVHEMLASIGLNGIGEFSEEDYEIIESKLN